MKSPDNLSFKSPYIFFVAHFSAKPSLIRESMIHNTSINSYYGTFQIRVNRSIVLEIAATGGAAARIMVSSVSQHAEVVEAIYARIESMMIRVWRRLRR